MDDDTPAYEAPSLETVGTLRELTLGEGVDGDADSFSFVSPWGYDIDVVYGAS